MAAFFFFFCWLQMVLAIITPHSVMGETAGQDDRIGCLCLPFSALIGFPMGWAIRFWWGISGFFVMLFASKYAMKRFLDSNLGKMVGMIGGVKKFSPYLTEANMQFCRGSLPGQSNSLIILSGQIPQGLQE